MSKMKEDSEIPFYNGEKFVRYLTKGEIEYLWRDGFVFEERPGLNFFFRPAGLMYISHEGLDLSSDEDEYIIQWGGNPEWDSGYDKKVFTSYREAQTFWDNLLLEEI